jgi:Flp pilus assembly protein TadG
MRLRANCRQRDDGASAVEFAILLPLFAMLTVGTISAGFAFHAWLNVTHGAQESSRFAATLSIDAGGGSTSSWLTQVSQRALAASDVTVSSTEAQPGTTGCVAVVSPTNIPPVSAHMTVSVDSAGSITRSSVLTGPCPDLPTMTGDYVQTQISTPVSFNYVLGNAAIQVAGKSVSRFEAVSLS